MAFQGEYFVERYGKEMVKRTPPTREILKAGIPVGAGTDATRVASYNPWTCLYWLVTGRTVGGLTMYDESTRLTREEALRLWTRGSARFSGDENLKGEIAVGKLADFAVLSDDFLTIPQERIRGIESLLTVVAGRCVYAAAPFADLDVPLPPESPEWAPAAYIGRHTAVGNGTHDAAGCAISGTRHEADSREQPSIPGCDCGAI
jgi:hypothetical protein